MQRYQVQGRWGLENLVGVDVDEPLAGPGRVRVKLRAVSLNYRDLLMVRGHYDPRLALPLVPGSDAVGEVVELGPGVRGLAVGDRVMTTFSPTWLAGPPHADALRLTRGGALPGVLAREVVDAELAFVKVPAFLSDFEAATLPCAGLTAWSALVELGGLRPGQTVLTLGSGGVSVFAVQIARMAGARVVATTSSEAKAARLRELGAEHVVLHTQDANWGRTVRAWSGGGVDQVVEVGGAGTLARSIEAVRPGGTVSLIGVLAGSQEPFTVLPVLMRQVRVQGVFVGHRAGLEALARALEVARVRPVVDRVFPWEQAVDAFRYLASGAHLGKVCISV